MLRQTVGVRSQCGTHYHRLHRRWHSLWHTPVIKVHHYRQVISWTTPALVFVADIVGALVVVAVDVAHAPPYFETYVGCVVAVAGDVVVAPTVRVKRRDYHRHAFDVLVSPTFVVAPNAMVMVRRNDVLAVVRQSSYHPASLWAVS